MTPTPTIAPAPPTPADVYSEENITTASTQPPTRPDLQDPYGLYDQFMGSQDLIDARSRMQETQNQINQSRQALRTTTSALENQNEQAMGGTGASINLIGKQVGRARDLTSRELAGLGEALQGQQAYLGSLEADKRNRYNIALKERENLNDLILQTGGNAGITYADSYESAISKASTWKKEEEKRAYKLEIKRREEEEKKRRKGEERAELKKALRALGKKTSGSKRELRRRLKKAMKSSGDYERKMKDLAYKIRLKEYNKPYYKPESTRSGGLTNDQKRELGINKFKAAFKANAGADGNVSPSTYARARSEWVENGLSKSSFEDIFSIYKNPNDYYN